jgi:soluble lytic murein transglycosylase-like protein
VKLLRAVAAQESGLRPCAVSEKGAQGLMQLMPDTAAEYSVEDPLDPEASLAAGAAFLRALLERYKGDLPRALAAYNAGPEIVDKSGIPDIPETRSYIDAITDLVGTKKLELLPIPPAPSPKAPEKPAAIRDP